MTDKSNVPELPESDDPEEKLRMENEFLKLKMQAELGAQSFTVSDIDPEMENLFLKNVMAFEQNHANAKPQKVYELMGKPPFKKADELNDAELAAELERISDVLAKNNIDVFFDEEIDERTRYSFITEELFEHESMFSPMPGMTTCFDYEEFHPNHKKDIKNRADEFIKHWFERTLDEKSWELGSEFILPDRRVLPKDEVVRQCKNIFDSYKSFFDGQYKIIDIGFQLDEGSGMGHAEGVVKYDALLENGAEVRIGGPFKLYMSLDYGWWNIVHIVFPGFQYP